MSPDLPLAIAGIGIMLAIPLTFMFANWVRKNVEYGEARFGPDGKIIEDKPAKAEQPRPDGPAKPAQRLAENETKAADNE